jgi:hypothetical protein
LPHELQPNWRSRGLVNRFAKIVGAGATGQGKEGAATGVFSFPGKAAPPGYPLRKIEALPIVTSSWLPVPAPAPRMYYDDEARRFNFISGLVLGIVLGSGLALIAAPRSPRSKVRPWSKPVRRLSERSTAKVARMKHDLATARSLSRAKAGRAAPFSAVERAARRVRA